jgi:hypothetical protein
MMMLEYVTHFGSTLPNHTNSDQWVVLSLWKMGDYKAARGLDASPYWVKLPGLALFNYLINIVELCGKGVPADCGRVG